MSAEVVKLKEEKEECLEALEEVAREADRYHQELISMRNLVLSLQDGSFDIVINRHGDLDAAEIRRVLKPGGVFVTQQVGAENDRELVGLLCGPTPMPFPEQYLAITELKFRAEGFEILRSEECFRPIRFFDVGALVWFARIIQWEFPGFSVDTNLDGLIEAQRLVEERGFIEGRIHRFLLAARKKG